jgi:hypothetical protein
MWLASVIDKGSWNSFQIENQTRRRILIAASEISVNSFTLTHQAYRGCQISTYLEKGTQFAAAAGSLHETSPVCSWRPSYVAGRFTRPFNLGNWEQEGLPEIQRDPFCWAILEVWRGHAIYDTFNQREARRGSVPIRSALEVTPQSQISSLIWPKLLSVIRPKKPYLTHVLVPLSGQPNNVQVGSSKSRQLMSLCFSGRIVSYRHYDYKTTSVPSQ